MKAMKSLKQFKEEQMKDAEFVSFIRGLNGHTFLFYIKNVSESIRRLLRSFCTNGKEFLQKISELLVALLVRKPVKRLHLWIVRVCLLR